jgi:hypothetical protein
MKLTWLLIFVLIVVSCDNKTEQQLQKSLVESIDITQEFNSTINSDISDKLYGIKFEVKYTSVKEEQQSGYLRLKHLYERLVLIDSISNDLISHIDSVKTALLLYGDIDKKAIKANFFPKTIDFSVLTEKDLQAPVDDFFLNSQHKKSIASSLFYDVKQIRKKLVELVANYELFENHFKINLLPINQFKNKKELVKLVEEMVDNSSINHKEDRQVIIDLYIILTLPEKIGNENWEKSHFQKTTLLSGLAKLTNLQNDIMRAKRLAMFQLFSKTGCNASYPFDKIIPIATGPMLVHANDTFEFKVLMAAFDSTGDPIVKINNNKGYVLYRGDGVARIKTALPKGTHTLKGSVSIQNRSGVLKTEEWEYKVNVIE